MHNKRAKRSRQRSNKTWFWHGYEILNTMDFQGVAWNEMVVLVQVKSEQVLTMTIAPSWFPLFCLQLKARERKGKAGQSRVSFSLSARGCLRGKGNTELVCLSLYRWRGTVIFQALSIICWDGIWRTNCPINTSACTIDTSWTAGDLCPI